MELKSLSNYNVAFRSLSISLVSVILVLCFLLVYKEIMHRNEVELLRSSSWAVDMKTGNASQATLVLSKDNPGRYFEYKGQVELFYALWFQFDQYSFNENVSKAMDLTGNCGKIMRQEYVELDYLKRLQEKNMVVTIQIDSIKIDMKSTPVHGICYARQTSQNANGQSKRRIYGTFDLFDLSSRSERNKHGVLIDNFEFFDKSKIEVE